jgi:D-alanyl-lipoteichoic acid acyltransferase DltB (MBOAT superfamily)
MLYWFVFNKSLKWQNALLLFSSYVFYGWWDWRFLFLLVFSTGLDFYTGLKIYDSKSIASKKIWLWISIGINLGFLGFFKYYNFFVESWVAAFDRIGYHMDPWTLKIVLPVGISFYTFHGLSYVIDIYKDRITPTRNWIDYSVFVSYFPLLVAGPIERATHLLPQIEKRREFNSQQAIDGIGLMLWGLFKKVVIADNLAPAVNDIFSQYESVSSGTLILGAIYFSFQIYGDFSGYSDIARGVSKLFGMELLLNFNFPYFSRSIPEFWRRWHISLSSWFKDYVYIPLGGSRTTKAKAIRNVFVIFLLSGFWHGANWTYIVWGGIHAFFFLPSFIFKTNRKYLGDEFETQKWYPSFVELFQIISTFILVTIAWVFFRAGTIEVAANFILKIFSSAFNVSKTLSWRSDSTEGSHVEFIVILILMASIHTLYFSKRINSVILKHVILMMTILLFGNFVNPANFIYFQF